MGSGWIVVADQRLWRVLGQDPRLNSGDLEMGRTHVGAYIRVHNKIAYWQRIVLTFSMGLV